MCDLYAEAVSSSDHVGSIVRMIVDDELDWIWKEGFVA